MNDQNDNANETPQDNSDDGVSDNFFVDILTGKKEKISPKKLLVQKVLRQLIESYGFDRDDIEVDYRHGIKGGKPTKTEYCHFSSGCPAMFKRAPRLYQELAIARADGSYPKLMNKLLKIKVLIIDDFCIASMSDPERRDLLEVLEDRQGISSTIIATQVPVENRIENIGDPTLPVWLK